MTRPTYRRYGWTAVVGTLVASGASHGCSVIETPRSKTGFAPLSSMTSLIYIHKGYSWYVPLALRNGRRFADDEVHFLGDRFGCAVARACGVNASNLGDFRQGADRFAAIYRHHSSLGPDFELFCIQRWFMLADFMTARGLDSCVYLDTDILLSKNIEDERARTLEFGLTYSGYSAHLCCVNRLSALQQFCNWIMALYSDPSSEERMIDWHRKLLADYAGGGVSDMTLFHWFQKDHPKVLGDYPAIFGDSPLEEVRSFQADEEGFKRLVWSDDRPSAVADDGRLIGLASLHHQGRAKALLTQNAAALGGNAALQTAMGKALELLYRA